VRAAGLAVLCGVPARGGVGGAYGGETGELERRGEASGNDGFLDTDSTMELLAQLPTPVPSGSLRILSSSNNWQQQGCSVQAIPACATSFRTAQMLQGHSRRFTRARGRSGTSEAAGHLHRAPCLRELVPDDGERAGGAWGGSGRAGQVPPHACAGPAPHSKPRVGPARALNARQQGPVAATPRPPAVPG
jgi:hypothetical protein